MATPEQQSAASLMLYVALTTVPSDATASNLTALANQDPVALRDGEALTEAWTSLQGAVDASSMLEGEESRSGFYQGLQTLHWIVRTGHTHWYDMSLARGSSWHSNRQADDRNPTNSMTCLWSNASLLQAVRQVQSDQVFKAKRAREGHTWLTEDEDLTLGEAWRISLGTLVPSEGLANPSSSSHRKRR